MPQLDGLRCFAVLLVVWTHAVGGWPRAFIPIGLGMWAVWLFFVLSGFLITGILLRGRQRAPHARTAVWRAFYARRLLRIFPLYYLVVAIGAIAAIGHSFRADLGWHLAYLGNWLMALRPSAFSDPAAPVWSLGVEEQFYLVWPALVLFAPLPRLPRIFTQLAVAAVLFREAALLIAPLVLRGPIVASSIVIVTPSNLDPLALGALLAWAREQPLSSFDRRHATRRALWIGLALASVLTVVTYVSEAHARVALVAAAPVSVALISVWLVDRAADGFPLGSVGARLLGNAAVRYVGTISYGIYLWHYPLLWTLARAGAFSGLRTGAAANVAIFAMVFSLTLIVASASWYLYERPINRLKRRFAYAKPAYAKPAYAKPADTSLALAVQPGSPNPESGGPWPRATRAALDGDALPAVGSIED